MKTNQKGRSMVEMLGVLAIIGVLSAGGLAGYSKAMFQHRVNQTIDEFNKVLQNFATIENKDWGIPEISGANDIINYGLMPDCKAIPDGCKLPLGYLDVDLAPISNGFPAGGLIYVHLNDSKSCIAFLSVRWDQSTPIEWWNYTKEDCSFCDDSGIEVVDMSEGTDRNYVYSPVNGKTEMVMSEIIDTCQICDNGEGCNIYFGIRYVF